MLTRNVAGALFSLFVLAACGDDDGGGASGTGAAGAGGGGGAGGGDPCAACEQLCVRSGCGDVTISCESQNGFCDGPATGPVCDCTGTVIEGDFAACSAAVSGTPIADPSGCQTGTFACGGESCQRNAEICVATTPGDMGATTYECRPLADVQGSCTGIPDCSCMDFTVLACGPTCACSADADHQETVNIALP
ncbi:MAG: hypothetical protein U0271_34420 [Polyangiaceae bacterium]